MIVKELLVKLGILVDAGEFQMAEHRLSRLSKATLALAGAATAVSAAKLGFKMAEDAARFEDALRIFEAAGHSLDKFRDKAKGTLSTVDLVEQMNFAESFQINEDAFLRFVDIADAASKKLGKRQDYVLKSLITGAARMEARWTDNAALIVNKKQVFAEYAKTLGLGSSKDLTTSQMREAFVADLLKQGDKMIEQVTKAGAQKGAGATDFYDSWKTSISGVKVALGTVFDAVIKNFAVPVVDFINKNEKRYFALAKTLAGYVAPAAKIATAALVILAVRGLGVVSLALYASAAASLKAALAYAVNAIASARAAVALNGYSFAAIRAAAATFSLRGAMNSLMNVPIVIGAAVVLVGLLLEELYANFSAKIGLFEQLSGRWDKVADLFWQAGKNPNNHPLLRAILMITAAAIEAIDTVDKLFGGFARAWYEIPEIQRENGNLGFNIVEAMTRAGMNATATEVNKVIPGFKGALGPGEPTIRQPTSVPYNTATSGRRSGSGTMRDHVQVDVNINANGASAADKQLANAAADEVKAITQDQITRARAATLPGSRRSASGASSAPQPRTSRRSGSGVQQ